TMSREKPQCVRRPCVHRPRPNSMAATVNEKRLPIISRNMKAIPTRARPRRGIVGSSAVIAIIGGLLVVGLVLLLVAGEPLAQDLAHGLAVRDVDSLRLLLDGQDNL